MIPNNSKYNIDEFEKDMKLAQTVEKEESTGPSTLSLEQLKVNKESIDGLDFDEPNSDQEDLPIERKLSDNSPAIKINIVADEKFK